MKNKILEEFFKEKLINYEASQPAPELWEKIKRHDKVVSYNRKQLLKRCGYIAIPVVAVLSVISYILLNVNQLNDTQLNITHIESKAETHQQPESINDALSTFIPEVQQPTNQTVVNYPAVSSPSDEISYISTTSYEPVQKPQAQPHKNVSDIHTSEIPQPTIHVNTLPDPSTSNAVSAVSIPSSAILLPLEEEQEDDTYEFEFYPQEKSDTLYIPSVFTPNGDGVNDIFLVFSPKKITDFDMLISNRSGTVIFRSKDINIGWNGEIANTPAPQGTYAYIIMFKDSYGRKQIKKGTINLMR